MTTGALSSLLSKGYPSFLLQVDLLDDHIFQSSKDRGSENDGEEILTQQKAISEISLAFKSVHLGLEQLPADYKESAKEDLANIISKYIENLNETILSKVLYTDIPNLFHDWSKNCVLLNNKTIRHPPFLFNKTDFIIANANYEEYHQNPNRTPTCPDFVFYLLNEEKAFSHMFNPKIEDWPKEFVFNTCSVLENWGYKPTDSPKAGDLIAYFSEPVSLVLQVKHWGIWLGEDRVLSKWGVNDVYDHPLSDVRIGYGEITLFFHKATQTALVVSYLEELTKASKNRSTFSHPAFRAPLSLDGCHLRMFQILEGIPVSSKRFFEGSIYNRDYNLKLRMKILESVYHFPREKLSRYQLIQSLQKLILAKAEEAKPTKIYNIAVQSRST